MPKEKEIGWYKKRHDTLKRTNVRLLLQRYGFEGFGWWMGIKDVLRELDDGAYKLFIDDEEVYNELILTLRSNKKRIDQFIEDCVEKYGILCQTDGYLWDPELCNDMQVHDIVRSKQHLSAIKTNAKRRASSEGRTIGELMEELTIVNGHRDGQRTGKR